MPTYDYDTTDGHNPEIIWHLLEHQTEFRRRSTFDQLDFFLRRKGPSAQTQLIQTIVQLEEAAQEARNLAVETSEQNHMRNLPDNEENGVTVSDAHNDEAHETHSRAESDYIELDEDTSELSFATDEGDSDSEDDEKNEPTDYASVMKRLSDRTSKNLPLDTDLILDADYFHGVHLIPSADDIVRSMSSERGQRHLFSPEADHIRPSIIRSGRRVGMPQGPFEVGYEHPPNPGHWTIERIVLPHVYLPGWGGVASEDVHYADEWSRGMVLAEGRAALRSMYQEDMALPDLEEVMTNLGFPSVQTFMHFIHRTEIKEAFRELWDACLRFVDSDAELSFCPYTRRPIALRIFYSRTLNGESEFDDEIPDKSNWQFCSHLARFCLKVEKVCNRWLLPPLRGQIPVLSGKVSSATVAWGGIELARILRRMQKGYRSRVRYLDVILPGEHGDVVVSNAS